MAEETVLQYCYARCYSLASGPRIAKHWNQEERTPLIKACQDGCDEYEAEVLRRWFGANKMVIEKHKETEGLGALFD